MSFTDPRIAAIVIPAASEIVTVALAAKQQEIEKALEADQAEKQLLLDRLVVRLNAAKTAIEEAAAKGLMSAVVMRSQRYSANEEPPASFLKTMTIVEKMLNDSGYKTVVIDTRDENQFESARRTELHARWS